MAKKKETDENTGLVRQFDDMKKKHPDAMLLFRTGDFYEIYRQDAVKAAAILAITLTDRIIPGEKEPMKMTMFPYNKLDTYLPKLIRAGTRVAICDQGGRPQADEDGEGGREKGTNPIKSFRYGKEEKGTGRAGRACPDSEERSRGETCQGRENRDRREDQGR